jgi:hypothetical protein
MKLLGLTALLLTGVLVFCLNGLRYMNDAALGTNAHINLSAWNYFLGAIAADDVQVAGISSRNLPAVISEEQFRRIRDAGIPFGRYLPELPHILDPWGHAVRVELTSISPSLQWRVSSRVGRDFWGRWVTVVKEFKRPNQSPEPTVMSVTPRADARVAPATPVAHL